MFKSKALNALMLENIPLENQIIQQSAPVFLLTIWHLQSLRCPEYKHSFKPTATHLQTTPDLVCFTQISVKCTENN